MLRIVIIFIFFWGLGIQAADSCHSFYEANSKSVFTQAVRSRIENIFGGRYEKLDSYRAHHILDDLMSYGSELDFTIFDLYLQIFESIPGSKRLLSTGAYYDIYSNVGVRVRSHLFQEQNWDLEKLYEYFFNVPLSLNFYRERDLDYLKHILSTSKQMAGEKTLARVLAQSNHSWAMKNLSPFPDIREEFERYQKDKTLAQLFSELKTNFHQWAEEPKLLKIRTARYEQINALLESLRISRNSSFDLFIASKYLMATKLFVNSEGLPPDNNNSADSPVTHLGIASLTLAEGSFKGLNHVIFQNSHDYTMKGFFVKTLNKMISTGPQTRHFEHSNPFQHAYFEAHNSVYQAIPKIRPPDGYQTDLQLYTRNKGPLNDTYENIFVEWNPISGYPMATLNWSMSSHDARNLSVDSVPILQRYIESYFDHFRKKNTYHSEEIKRDKEAEWKSNLVNSSFFIFTLPHSVNLVTMVRLFDATKTKTFIEREFQDIEIPERKKGEPIYEIGRLFATEEADGNSLGPIMARVAQHLKNTNAKGTIYLDANRAGMKYYSRRRAKVIYTPEQLNQPTGATPLWVMKYTVNEFIKEFLTNDYQTVKTRIKK